MHRPLVQRPSTAGLTTHSETSGIPDKQSSVSVGGEQKKEEKGRNEGKEGKMSRIFEKKQQQKNKSANKRFLNRSYTDISR